MALLPTIAAQIFERMDVEGISKELQAQSKRVAPILEYVSELDEAERLEAERTEIERCEAERSAHEGSQRPNGDGIEDTIEKGEHGGADASQAEKPAEEAAPAHADQEAPMKTPAEAPAETPTEPPTAKAVTEDPPAREAQVEEHAPVSPAAANQDVRAPKRAPEAVDLKRQRTFDRVFEASPPPISKSARLPPATQPLTPQFPARPTQEEVDASVAAFEEERRATKLRLWNQIKLTSFSRLITSLYALALLALQTHIQLNLIGRRTYVSSLEAQARDDTEQHRIAIHGLGGDAGEEEEQAHTTDRQYLTCSWWFLHNGWKIIADRVETAVAAEVGDTPLRTLLSATHLREIVQRIRERIDLHRDEPAHGYSGVLLPTTAGAEVDMLRTSGAIDQPESVSGTLRQLLDETNDYIDSPDFATVLDASLDRVFDMFYSALAPSFGTPGIAETPLLLAKALPLIAQQAQAACYSSPNEYANAIAELRELRAMSVLIYSSWDDELE